MENARNRIKVEFIKKESTDNIIKQQSKLTFIGNHESYENHDSYTFKQNEVFMEKLIYLGFSVLELSSLLVYETYYDKSQPYFRQENIQLQYMDTDSFVLGVNAKDIIEDLTNLEDLFDFSNLNELFSNKTKKCLVNLKLKLLKKNCIDGIVYLRSKMYAFKCDEDSKNKLNGISESQSKLIIFEQYKKYLDGE